MAEYVWTWSMKSERLLIQESVVNDECLLFKYWRIVVVQSYCKFVLFIIQRSNCRKVESNNEYLFLQVDNSITNSVLHRSSSPSSTHQNQIRIIINNNEPSGKHAQTAQSILKTFFIYFSRWWILRSNGRKSNLRRRVREGEKKKGKKNKKKLYVLVGDYIILHSFTE